MYTTCCVLPTPCVSMLPTPRVACYVHHVLHVTYAMCCVLSTPCVVCYICHMLRVMYPTCCVLRTPCVAYATCCVLHVPRVACYICHVLCVTYSMCCVLCTPCVACYVCHILYVTYATCCVLCTQCVVCYVCHVLRVTPNTSTASCWKIKHLIKVKVTGYGTERYLLNVHCAKLTHFCLTRDTHELKVDQAEWVREKTEMVYSLLEETPPDGVAFVQTVKHILKVNFYALNLYCWMFISLTFKWPLFIYVNACKTPLEIYFMYLGNYRICHIFKTCCIISVYFLQIAFVS